ncbi:uncharacterized protein [Rutidosis leptorrhynchoides]|uniref:uncharacterized protein isoform X2 n=1 Tax=Rutidosis leptorrhynchoides TaxID=125765 RepID=UPI003A9977BD
MDVQDHTIPSGHDSHHGVHLCHRCGWPFPNPHPSAKQRRSHKKVCGKLEGYTTLIGSPVVSDDEHNPDDDKEKSPSPKIEKTSIDGGGIRGSFSRSEEDLFADAVTEFTDDGSAKKSLDRDLYYSFTDADNVDTTDVVKAPVEINKVDVVLEASEKHDTHVDKSGETEMTTVSDFSESKLELTDGVVGPTTCPSYVAESVEVLDSAEGKSQIYVTSTEEAKDSDISKTTPEVSETVGEYEDDVKEENLEKWESAKADLIDEVIKQEVEGVYENASEVTKESEKFDGAERIGEEVNLEKVKSDLEHVTEVANELEIDQNVAGLTEMEQIQEVVEVSDVGLTEKHDLCAVEVEKCSNQQIQEVVEDISTVSTPKNDLEEPILKKGSTEQTNQVVEKLDSILAEMENFDAPELEECSKEQIQVAVKDPKTVLIEKEDLGEFNLEKLSNKQTHEEVVERPDSILTEKSDLGRPILEKSSDESQPDSSLVEKVDDGAPKSDSDECSKENAQEVIQLKVDDVNNDADEVSCETVTPKDSSNISVDNGKNVSVIVPEAIVEQVLSTTSHDAETLHIVDKSKFNSEKSSAGTLVEPEGTDQKSCSSELQDSKPQPNSETLTKVNNESKTEEDVIAKVTNWSTGKPSTPLKNLLGEAKSPSVEQPEPVVVQKDENEKAGLTVVNHDISSPPKLIDDGKKGRKKVRSWVPFVCCSSVNVAN